MSTLNASPAAPTKGKARVTRTLGTLATAASGALAVVIALAFLPSNFVSQLLSPLLPSAIASEETFITGAGGARGHRLTDALHAEHGTYVSDPYGCLYVFQYLDSRLSLMPLRDENRHHICRR